MPTKKQRTALNKAKKAARAPIERTFEGWSNDNKGMTDPKGNHYPINLKYELVASKNNMCKAEPLVVDHYEMDM